MPADLTYTPAAEQSIPEADIVLRDGSTLHLRPVKPSDAHPLQALHERLSPASLYSRFFRIPKSQTAEVQRLLHADGRDTFVVVGEAHGEVCAVASCTRDPHKPDRAEVSFVIADRLQGRGAGTRLLELMAAAVRPHGIQTFDAYVLAANDQMMRVFLDSGFAIEQQLDAGVFHVTLSLDPTSDYVAKAASRAEVAATASMNHFFEPQSVVVIGASRERGKIGSEILHNVRAGGYAGRLAAVHPSASIIDDVPAYPRVTDVPGEIDLAVISVPAARVGAVVDDCIEKGVKAIVVITAGFGETGAEGRAVEEGIVEKIRQAGIRLVGPNCMGLVNTDPAVRLNATFSPVSPPAGRVAMSTQSGALGLAVLDYARRLRIGLSTFVSIGNKADVSSNDLIQYWANDPRTSVILLYVESFGNPAKFSQITRRVGRRKPIIAVKAGRSAAGARAATSHTGALASSDAIVDALFRQSGVIRTATLEELFDTAKLLANQPVPSGRRVGILTNAGGPAILAADACEAQGLRLPALSDRSVEELRSLLPPAAAVANPIDMLASASADQYERSLDTLLADENVDSALVIFIPPLVTKGEDVAGAIQRASRKHPDKPVLAIFMSADEAPALLDPIPCFRFPEAAAGALAHAATYGEWLRTPLGTVPILGDIDRAAARGVIDRALAQGGGWLPPPEAQALLDAIHVPLVRSRFVASAAEAVAAANDLGYPVVLKATGERIVHKTDIGAVKLRLESGPAVREVWEQMRERLGDMMSGAVVQEMASGGVEMLIGSVDDRTFGQVLACATGGTLAELFADSQFRLHPLTDLDAGQMIDQLRGARLLRGYRGAPPADARALTDALLRMSALVGMCPEIRELDINPLLVREHGVVALDVRARVERPQPPPATRRVSYS